MIRRLLQEGKKWKAMSEAEQKVRRPRLPMSCRPQQDRGPADTLRPSSRGTTRLAVARR
jgi:hypothetical protein